MSKPSFTQHTFIFPIQQNYFLHFYCISFQVFISTNLHPGSGPPILHKSCEPSGLPGQILTQLTNHTSNSFLALKINYCPPFLVWFWVDEKWLLSVVTVGLGFSFPRGQLLSPLAVISRSEWELKPCFLSCWELSEPGQLMGIKSRAKKSQVGATVMY